MITAAAHRCGKQLAADLAKDGYDVAVCSLAVLKSRIRIVESFGQKAVALRLYSNDAAGAQHALGQIHERLGPVDVLIHIGASELWGYPAHFDATTRVVMDDLIERAGTIVFLYDAPAAGWPEAPPGVKVIALTATDRTPPRDIGSAIIALLREGRAGWFRLEGAVPVPDDDHQGAGEGGVMKPRVSG